MQALFWHREQGGWQCVRGDFSAELSAATAGGCQQYAGTRGTKARSGAGEGAELPPSFPPAEPGGAPESVRGAGTAGPPGAGSCPRCWSRELSAVLGSVPLRHSVEGSPPLAGHGEEAVPKGFQRGARRWEEEEEGAGCPQGTEGMPQPPSCPRRAGRPGVGAQVRRQFFAGDDVGLTGWGWREEDAEQEMLPGRVGGQGWSPQLSVLYSPQGQSLFRDQLVPNRAAPAD